MRSGEMAETAAGKRQAQQSAMKSRVSPELAELMHMLSSLENQANTRDERDE